MCWSQYLSGRKTDWPQPGHEQIVLAFIKIRLSSVGLVGTRSQESVVVTTTQRRETFADTRVREIVL